MYVSFIVPVYNASKTICRTLDSIYKEAGLCEFEVIIVDDKSTDDSIEIIEDYCSQHKIENLQLLKQPKNHRQGAARNRALNIAQGEYIHFVDADDTIQNGVWTVVRKAMEFKPDVILCGYEWDYGKHKIETRLLDNWNENSVVDGKLFLEKYYTEWIGGSPWAYLWRRQFLHNIHGYFIEDRRMEDIDWIERCLYQARKVCYSEHIIYRVYTNDGSTTHTVSADTMADWIHHCYRRLVFIKDVRNELPIFVQKVEPLTKKRVADILRYRNLTKMSLCENLLVYKKIGSDAICCLKQNKWPLFTSFYLHTPFLALLFVGVSFPCAFLGRKITNFIRSI